MAFDSGFRSWREFSDLCRRKSRKSGEIACVDCFAKCIQNRGEKRSMVKFDTLGDRWCINGCVKGMSDGLVGLRGTFDNVP